MVGIINKLISGVIAMALIAVTLYTSHDGAHIRYFPEQPLHPREKWHFTRHLKAMGFPVLTPAEKDKEYLALRVLMLPSFSEPVAIQYEYDAGIFQCRSVILSGKGGYEPGRIVLEQNARLDEDSLNKLKQSINESDLWKLPGHGDHNMIDGTSLVTELIRNGNRHVWIQDISGVPDGSFSGQFIGVGCWDKTQNHRGSRYTFDGYVFRQ